MREYLLTGRTPDGRLTTEIVEAPSGDEAYRAFEDRGRTDIVLHTSETVAQLFKASSMAGLFRPHEIAATRTMGGWALTALIVRRLYAKLWPVLAVPVAAAVFWWVYDESIGFWAAVAALSLLGPGLLALYFWYRGGFPRYRRLQEAVGWGRWDEVLQLVSAVKMKLPAYELPLRKAQALAGLGRTAEALAVYDQLDDNPDYPRPVFWSGLAIVYTSGHDRENALAVLERAHELMPENPDTLIDLAGLVTTVRGDLVRAKGLLAAARKHVLADTAYPFYRAAEGLIAMAEKRAADAVAAFDEAVRLTEPFLRGNPSVRYYIARLWAQLALAHAAAGDHEAARREADRARPVLTAHRDDIMLARLADAVG